VLGLKNVWGQIHHARTIGYEALEVGSKSIKFPMGKVASELGVNPRPDVAVHLAQRFSLS